MDDSIINLISGILILLGFAGVIIPALPGAPLALIGILVFKLFSGDCSFGWEVISLAGLFVILGAILEYVLPVALTKKFGGTKYGVWGSVIGLIVGMFFPPIGFIIGPFFGALIGELAFGKKEMNNALKSAFGSFVGFLLTTGFDLILCLILFGIFIWDIFIH